MENEDKRLRDLVIFPYLITVNTTDIVGTNKEQRLYATTDKTKVNYNPSRNTACF